MAKKVLFLLTFCAAVVIAYTLFAQDAKKLEGRKVLMVIASSNFRDEEYSVPRQALEQQGAKITIACSSLNESVGMLKREKVKPDVLITKVKADSYDAVVFIGGVGAKEYFSSKTALKLAVEAYKQKKIVAAICIAPSILANAGVLKGKKATVYQSEANNLKKGGANYTGGAVEVDGNIITASGPQAAQQFANELAKALAEFKILFGKKIVMIIANDKFRDEELQKPKEILSKLGAEVTVAAAKKATCKGMLGAEVEPDTTISKVKADKFDAVVFVGGIGAKELFNDKKVHKIAKDTVKKKKVLGAICIAPSILANAGVLKGKKATAYKSEKENLAKKGAKVQDEDVVIDGKIVTANGPEAAEKFANALAKALRGD